MSIPVPQRIIILDLDFMMLRILVMFAVMRIFARSEYRDFSINTIDKLVLLWGFFGIITYTLLWKTFGSFVNRLGFYFDIFGIYFMSRFLIRDYDDIKRVINMFLFLCIPLAVAMLIEKSTGRNFFSVFGGVPEITMIRDGRLRCQGPFLHPILAGTFAASLLPIAIVLWRGGSIRKFFPLASVIAVTIITITSSSSGPAITFMVGFIGLLFFPVRFYMRYIYISIFLMTIFLHMVMKAPVWFLVGRLTVIGSSTGYHRSMLIDSFVNSFREWWFVGTQSTAHWGHYGLNMWDVTNHYVQIAVNGGLITLIIFLIIIVLCYRTIGIAVLVNQERKNESLFYWALGASLLAHSASFMGVSYFDQIILPWYMFIGIISTISNINKQQIFQFHEQEQLDAANAELAKISEVSNEY
jgi:hypothetical protein